VTIHHSLELLAEHAPRYNAWILRRCAPYLGDRVLDYGAGTGTFTALLAESGRPRSVVAFEPEPAHAAYIREHVSRPDVRVVERLDGGEFDAILCVNVLEHIAGDREALGQMYELLAPGGHVLLLTPAHPALYGAYDHVTGHVRRYGKSELRAKLEHAGFELRELRHVNPVGALGWLVSGRVLRRAEIGRTSLELHDRMVPALRLLDHLRLPVGLSLWAVAVKPRP
jgi:2-polyprenyl-3-methyl-5-hydroxy-6-metoxy-1,4-benzoquinol methylase